MNSWNLFQLPDGINSSIGPPLAARPNTESTGWADRCPRSTLRRVRGGSVAWWLGGVVRYARCAPWCGVGKYWLGRRVGRDVRVQSARREGGGIGRRHHAGPPRPSSEGPSSQWPRSRFTEKMVMMAGMDERKVVAEFCHLLEKSKQLFNGLRDLPQYGHKQWQGYFGRTFDIYTKLWKFQQQHRWVR